MSRSPISGDYIKAEAKAGRMGARLMAIVAEGSGADLPAADGGDGSNCTPGRARVEARRQVLLADARAFAPTPMGMTKWSDLFTDRQLVALTTFSDLVQEVRQRVNLRALTAGMAAGDKPLNDGGTVLRPTPMQ